MRTIIGYWRKLFRRRRADRRRLDPLVQLAWELGQMPCPSDDDEESVCLIVGRRAAGDDIPRGPPCPHGVECLKFEDKAMRILRDRCEELEGQLAEVK